MKHGPGRHARANSSQAVWWAIILALAALAIWLAKMLMESRH